VKALSIRAPWWWFILHCGKDIENRDWPTKFRGTIYLHASKWWNAREARDDFDCALSIYEAVQNVTLIADLDEPELPSITLRRLRESGGCLVGTVDIVDCVTQSASPWFFGDYGFVLRNPVAFEKPIPCKGALGFFEVREP